MANLAGGAVKSSTPFQLYRRLALGGDGVCVQTITAAVIVTVQHEEVLVLNPSTGTRVVTLPTAAAGAKKGMLYLIMNSGTTYNLTINKPASTTLATLNPGQFCIVVHTGSAWVLAASSSSATTAYQMNSSGVFLSAEQTGTGGPQNVAHGFGSTPVLAYAIPSDITGGAYAVSYGAHGATNVVVTVTNGEKYRIVAHK